MFDSAVDAVNRLFDTRTAEERLDAIQKNLERALREHEAAEHAEFEAQRRRVHRSLNRCFDLCEEALIFTSDDCRRIVKKVSSRPQGRGQVTGDEASELLVTAPSDGNVIGVNEERRSVTVVLTTGEEDRVGDVVHASGVVLDNYRGNSVVLANHDSEGSFPIGSATDPETGECTVRYDRRNDRLTAELFIAKGYDLAETAWNLLRQGVLKAVSIGFRPLEEPRHLRSGGMEFPRWELLEISLVSIPCNASALVYADAV
jgi:hypothetical protein